MDAHLEMGHNNITYEDLKAAADGERQLGRETLAIWERTAQGSWRPPAEYGEDDLTCVTVTVIPSTSIARTVARTSR